MDERPESFNGEFEVGVSDLDVGERLRQARRSRGLTEEQVAQDLHINVRHVVDIEHNKFDQFASAVFVKGYLRNYARLLALEPDPIIKAFDQATGAEEPALSPIRNVMASGAHGANIPWGTLGTLVLVLVGVAGVGWIGNGVYRMLKETENQAEVTLPNIQLPLSEPVEGAAPVDESVRLPGKAPNGTVTQEITVNLVPEADESAESAPSTVETPPELVDEPVADVPAQPQANVTLHFSADSWVEVYDATDLRLVSRIGKAGSTSTVEGVPPFSVVLGYAPGVSVEYNGEPVEVVTRRGRDVARFKVGARD